LGAITPDNVNTFFLYDFGNLNQSTASNATSPVPATNATVPATNATVAETGATGSTGATGDAGIAIPGTGSL
jgi:hypothetical protein